MDLKANLALGLVHIDLVSEHHEREVVWIVWACLDKEFVSPALKCLERFGRVDVEDEYTAIGTAIECHTK